MKIKEIAALLEGSVVGDGEIVIERIRAIDEASQGDLTFVANPRYRSMLKNTKASAVLVTPGTEFDGVNLIIVNDPYIALGKILALYYPEDYGPPGISQQAFLEQGASISPDATIYPGVTVLRGARIGRRVVLHSGVFVGHDAVIDDDSIIYPHVSIYRKCLIGKRVVIHAGAVIGSDGFGFANPGSGNMKIPQVGIVQIDDDVEIGANTTIDRGTLGKTWIKRNVKIDNLVQIAHNVIIGENSIIVAQVGISGSTKLGKSVIIGGQAGLVGHISVGDKVMIGAQSGIHDDIPGGQTVSGSPHLPHREWLRVSACLSRLPDMRKLLTVLSTKIEKLESKRDNSINHENSSNSDHST